VPVAAVADMVQVSAVFAITIAKELLEPLKVCAAVNVVDEELAAIFPVTAGSVSVLVPAVAGTSNVMSPEEEPLSLIGIFIP